ncbi:MAG: hypothetical protein HQ581_14295 [Planctomycetes bacterium]|nr:hypothetical protein [Planctomycetota bacterium]
MNRIPPFKTQLHVGFSLVFSASFLAIGSGFAQAGEPPRLILRRPADAAAMNLRTRLYFANSLSGPDAIWKYVRGSRPTQFYRRPNAPEPAKANPIPGLASLVFARNGDIYFCSGLEGCIYRLVGGKNETLFHATQGQVREVELDERSGRLYYSVMETPQGRRTGLGNGIIRAIDLKTKNVLETISVEQSDVGHGWWGTFAVRDGRLFLGAMGYSRAPSEIYERVGTRLELRYQSDDEVICGMTFAPDGDLYFTTGGWVFVADRLQQDDGSKVFRLRDFETRTLVHRFDSLTIPDIAFP